MAIIASFKPERGVKKLWEMRSTLSEEEFNLTKSMTDATKGFFPITISLYAMAVMIEVRSSYLLDAHSYIIIVVLFVSLVVGFGATGYHFLSVLKRFDWRIYMIEMKRARLRESVLAYQTKLAGIPTRNVSLSVSDAQGRVSLMLKTLEGTRSDKLCLGIICGVALLHWIVVACWFMFLCKEHGLTFFGGFRGSTSS